jgi:hypothetical protein
MARRSNSLLELGSDFLSSSVQLACESPDRNQHFTAARQISPLSLSISDPLRPMMMPGREV